MQSAHVSVFARDDTLFGVSAALGEDFGFNPVFLRAMFALSLFWNPVAAVGAYAGLGALVAISRWLVPEPRSGGLEEADAGPSQDALNAQDQAWQELAAAA